MKEDLGRLMASEESVVNWLLDGDPAIRWQVMRDLLDEPVETWERERRQTMRGGWVADLLARQGADGEWPAGRWTASTWTLLLLVALGLPGGHPAGRAPIERLLDKFVPEGANVDSLLKRVDLCHLGFALGLGAHFLADDPRLPLLSEAVLTAQFDDGGWNCHMRNYPNSVHSSFHTTLNVLENLQIGTRAPGLRECARMSLERGASRKGNPAQERVRSLRLQERVFPAGRAQRSQVSRWL